MVLKSTEVVALAAARENSAQVWQCREAGVFLQAQCPDDKVSCYKSAYLLAQLSFQLSLPNNALRR